MGAAEEAFWDLYATWYDKLCWLLPYQEEMRDIMSALEPAATPKMRVLDAACGTGELLRLIAERYPEAELHGVDRSAAMLKVARRKLEGKRVELVCKDLDEPFAFWPDGTFDVVTSVNTLYALKGPQKFLEELRRVLKPGGTLVLVNPYYASVKAVWSRHFRLILERRAARELARTLVHSPVFTAITALNLGIAYMAGRDGLVFLPPEKLKAMFRDTGFAIKQDHDTYAGTCRLITA